MSKNGGGGSSLDINALSDRQEEMNRVNIFSPYGSQMFGSSQVDDEGNIVFVPGTGDDQRAMQIIESPFQTRQRQPSRMSRIRSQDARRSLLERLPTEAATLTRVGNGPRLSAIGEGPTLGMVGSSPTFDRVGNAPTLQSDLSLSGLTTLPGTNDFEGARNSLEAATFTRRSTA